jgi:hypothetical protein
MVPVRATGPPYRATTNVNQPPSCPLAELVRTSQFAWLVADHVHEALLLLPATIPI